MRLGKLWVPHGPRAAGRFGSARLPIVFCGRWCTLIKSFSQQFTQLFERHQAHPAHPRVEGGVRRAARPARRAEARPAAKAASVALRARKHAPQPKRSKRISRYLRPALVRVPPAARRGAGDAARRVSRSFGFARSGTAASTGWSDARHLRRPSASPKRRGSARPPRRPLVDHRPELALPALRQRHAPRAAHPDSTESQCQSVISTRQQTQGLPGTCGLLRRAASALHNQRTQHDAGFAWTSKTGQEGWPTTFKRKE